MDDVAEPIIFRNKKRQNPERESEFPGGVCLLSWVGLEKWMDEEDDGA